jgi:hypothetical protein
LDAFVALNFLWSYVSVSSLYFDAKGVAVGYFLCVKLLELDNNKFIDGFVASKGSLEILGHLEFRFVW